MPTPGLLFVRSRITSPDLTDSAFNEWYSEVHLSDVLESGLADLALRYKNANPEAKYPYLAVYRLPDLGFVQDEKKMQTIPMKSELLPGSGEVGECTDMDIRAYEIIQRFEGQVEKEGRGEALISVAMEPAEGTDDDFDEWYRKQHLDMLSMCRGYRRSTRYRFPAGTEAGRPRYLALHEYDTMDLPTDQIKMVVSTEWSKRVIGAAKAFDRDVWKLIKEKGKSETKL